MSSTQNIRRRAQDVPKPDIDLRDRNAQRPGLDAGRQYSHPGGRKKHGQAMQYLRMFTFVMFFIVTCIVMNIAQYIGAPLYFLHKDWYYAWMAMTKQHFGVLLMTMQKWWCPTLVRVSGDESVRGQLRRLPDGRMELDFPERIVVIANHQLYTDWLYLWWSAYAAHMHGHLFIILKDTLKYIPILGQGMQFFSFIFLSRKWDHDQAVFAHRLQKLKTAHHGPLSGTQNLDPMWLLIFPEGTNMSKTGRSKSKAWADKEGIEDLEHALLPRSRGLLFCLQELKGTIEWVYDCTVAYEGVPRGQYGQDIFTLPVTYLQGRPPPSVNMHWRRFAMSSIPLHDSEAFEKWLIERWREKDELLEIFTQTGRFPADGEIVTVFNGSTGNGSVEKSVKGPGYIETEVTPAHPLEFLQVYVPFAALLLVGSLGWRLWGFANKLRGAAFGPVLSSREDLIPKDAGTNPDPSVI